MNFKKLQEANVKRNNEVFSPCNNWSLMEWGCAMAGEAGELCNILKKIKRMGENTNSAKDPQNIYDASVKASEEMADVIIYINIIASKMNIDLERAIIEKFNEVSIRMNSTIFISDDFEIQEYTPTINIDEENWKAIKQAASESKWMPEEYMSNDWVSDVCDYLRNGMLAKTTLDCDITSSRGMEWLNFSIHVFEHIEHYAIKQYGDKPKDQLTNWTKEHCLEQVEKYINRFGKVTEERQIRDFLKMAHYVQAAFAKYIEENNL